MCYTLERRDPSNSFPRDLTRHQTGACSLTPKSWFRKPYLVRYVSLLRPLSITLCNAVVKSPIERSEKGDVRSRWASFVNTKHASPFKIYQLFKRRSDGPIGIWDKVTSLNEKKMLRLWSNSLHILVCRSVMDRLSIFLAWRQVIKFWFYLALDSFPAITWVVRPAEFLQLVISP